LLSTPAAEHQTDIEGYLRRERAEETTFLEAFGTHGEVEGERVLDLGCGLGAKATAVARAGAEEVVGVDFDLEKVHGARSLADRVGARDVRLAVQSGTDLAFGHDRFDVVLLLDVIEHMPDPETVLAECARVLRKGGRVLVSFPPYRSAWGGHLFTHVPVPWVHLLFPDREVLDLWREIYSKAVVSGKVRCSAKRAHAIIEAETTAALWDCNGMTISRFLDLVDRAPLELKEIRFKTLGNLAGFVTRMPKLREFLVTRLMIVLEA
jgi:2-polyprenyl-3-methyl-5-hydroxy-6-metoxy-1,4-benzoquinol methylase